MQKLLVECEPGSKVKIVNINAGLKARKNLQNFGIQFGDIVKIKRKNIMKGPMIVESNGSEIAIGYGLAQKIIVEEE